MAWKTILTNGRGLYGTSDFFASLALRQPVPTRVFAHARPEPAGPNFDRSSAVIDRVNHGYDGLKKFCEMVVHFDPRAYRIGVHSFVPHQNILSLFAAEMEAPNIANLESRQITVFHMDDWDFGFSAQADIDLGVGLSEVLVSGSMYVGFPIFFQRIAIKGGIIEGAEGVWKWAKSPFPFEMSEGRICSVVNGENDEAVLSVQASNVAGSFSLPRSLLGSLRKMFDVESCQDLVGKGVMVFYSADDHEALAVRPVVPHDRLQ